MNNLVVITQKTDKANITDFGAPDKFLQQVQYLLGEQVFAGQAFPRSAHAQILTSLAEGSALCMSWGEEVFVVGLLAELFPVSSWSPAISTSLCASWATGRNSVQRGTWVSDQTDPDSSSSASKRPSPSVPIKAQCGNCTSSSHSVSLKPAGI